MDEFIAALIGALVGGLITILGSFKLDEHQRNKRRENLRSALSVEVASLVEIARRQDYANELRLYSAVIRNAPKAGYPTLQIPASHQYFSIFEGNSSSIGELEVKEAAAIIAFYQQARSLLDSMSRDGGINSDIVTNLEAAERYDAIANDFDRLCAFGHELVERLSTGSVAATIMQNARALSRPNEIGEVAAA